MKCNEVSRPLNEDEQKKNHVLRIQCIIIAERWIKRWNSIIIFLEIFLEVVEATVVLVACLQEQKRTNSSGPRKGEKHAHCPFNAIVFDIITIIIIVLCDSCIDYVGIYICISTNEFLRRAKQKSGREVCTYPSIQIYLRPYIDQVQQQLIIHAASIEIFFFLSSSIRFGPLEKRAARIAHT